MKCRHCKNNLKHVFLDLGFAPPSNAYLNLEDLNKPETTYPLKTYVCESCWLVQTIDYSDAEELFSSDYAYFSSISKSWLEHAKNYVYMIKQKLKLNKDSYVIEIASNDGYLLKNFVELEIPCVGIEPTNSTADAAEKLGVSVIREFFSHDLALQLSKQKKADLIIGNNVYAHVPDINNFTNGLKAMLKDDGVVTLEFPHLLNLINLSQFDTIYHEHFSYLSLYTVNKIFTESGLKIFDVEKLPTHGGSLRIYGCHVDDSRSVNEIVYEIIDQEEKERCRELSTYTNFQNRVNKIKNDFLSFLLEQNRKGKKIVAYGAAAKGNTLLNYLGVKSDLISYIVDNNAVKQGKFMPGSHIPIVEGARLKNDKPNYVVILPWNLKTELTEQLDYIRDWGGYFVVTIPQLEIV